MLQKCRNLSLFTLMMAAISAIGAAGANAAELHATTSGSVSIFGAQGADQHVFQTTPGKVVAKQATFEATAGITAQTLSVTATYNEATAFGQTAKIVMNGCTYTVTNKSPAGVTTAKTAYVDIVCPEAKRIEIITAICTVTVPSQTGKGVIVGTNNAGTPHDISATMAVSGITYQNHGMLCPNYKGVTGETRHDGTYTAGATTFQARVDTGGVLTTKDGYQFTKLNQNGALVGLEVT